MKRVRVTSKQSLREVAQFQHGYFTAQQAKLAGFQQCNHDYHVNCGNWRKIDRGLFRLPGYEDTLESDFVRWSFWATGQAINRQVTVSHESALHYYGLLAMRPMRVHLSVSSLRREPENPHCQLHHETVPQDEVVRREGFYIVTPHFALREMKPDLLYQANWGATLHLAVRSKRLTLSEACALGDFQPEEWNIVPATMAEVAASATATPSPQNSRRTTQPTRYWHNDERRTGGLMTQARSFTLVEMLVVIAIITILAGLLLPSLNRAAESARGTQCQNNLRMVAQGIFSYADNFNGFVPNYGYANTRPYTIPPLNWVIPTPGPLVYLTSNGFVPGFQTNSTKENPVTTCPTFWPAVPVANNWGGGFPQNTIYAMGGTYSFNCHADITLMSGPTNGQGLKRFASLPRPSKRFIYGEGIAWQCRTYTSSQEFGGSYVWYGHNQSANFQFGDGHIEALSVDRVAIATAWPAQGYGKDTPLGFPW